MELSPMLARIHGHVCGDGYMFVANWKRPKTDIIRYNRKNKRETVHLVAYSNTEQALLNEFKNAVQEVFNASAYIRGSKNEVWVKNKRVYNEIISLGKTGTYEWTVPVAISAEPRLFFEWLSAFIDDEGYIEDRIETDKKGRKHSKKRINIKSASHGGLLSIMHALLRYGIKSRIDRAGDFRVLRIEGLENLKRLIPYLNLSHPRKLLCLKNMITDS
jgi:hypothetical protein